MVRQLAGQRSGHERHVVGQPAIRVEGLTELRRGLRHVKDDGLDKALKDANKWIADTIVRKALPKVPVRSGRLRTSVRGLGSASGAVGKAGGSRVPYAAAIHWGRSRGSVNFKHGRFSGGQGDIQGRPFLQDAARSLEDEAADRYADEIDDLLNKVRARGVR